MNPCASPFRFFLRLYKDHQLYVSSSYQRRSRISSYVKYKYHSRRYHGNILTFGKTCDSIDRSNGHPTTIESLLEFSSSQDIDAISVSELLSVCYVLSVDGQNYVGDPLNTFELE